MKVTLPAHRFRNRIDHFVAGLELAEIFTATASASPLIAGELFLGINKLSHPILSARTANLQNRKIAIGQFLNTIRGAFIKDLYEEFSEYLSDILTRCAKQVLNGSRLIGNHHFKIEANDLIKLKDWDGVMTHISKAIFRQLENERSTINLIRQIDKKLDLKIPEAEINAAMPYLEMRHLLVHANGKVDEKFAADYPALRFIAGNEIGPSKRNTQDAKKAVSALVDTFDSAVIALKLVTKADCQC